MSSLDRWGEDWLVLGCRQYCQGLVTSPVLPKEYAQVLRVLQVRLQHSAASYLDLTVLLQDRALTRTGEGEVEQMFLEDFGKSHKELFAGVDI